MGSFLDKAMNDPGRNKEPDPNAEYIYNSTMVWPVGGKFMDGHTTVKKGRIVIKVRKDKNERLFFEFKDEPGVSYSTNYGWSFVLNTPENAMLYKEYLDRCAEIDRLGNINKHLFKKRLITLDNTR